MKNEVVRVVTPLPLTEEQKEIIKNIYLAYLLRRILPSRKRLTLLSWGSNNRLGETLIDCSVKTQLQKIKRENAQRNAQRGQLNVSYV